MKKSMLIQVSIAFCMLSFSVIAQEYSPAASWMAAPDNSAMIYRIYDKAPRHYVDDKNAVFRVFNGQSRPETGAFFQHYYCRVMAPLPSSLCKEKGNLTVTGSFCLDNVEKSDPVRSPLIFRMQKISLFVNRAGNVGGKGQLSLNIQDVKGSPGDQGDSRYIDSGVRVDDSFWHTFAISINNNVMSMWVDGQKVKTVKEMTSGSNPLPFDSYVQIGGAAKSLWISKIMFFDQALPEQVIAEKTAAFSKSPMPKFVPFELNSKHAESKVLSEKIELSDGEKPEAELLEVKAISDLMRLPFKRPEDAARTGSLCLTAAPGEYEPVSFVINAKTNLPQVAIKSTSLKGVNENIEADSIDIKTVKCWYQSGCAWVNVHVKPKIRVLTPELLLNDDALVKVDYELKRNYVKINDDYVEMSSLSTDGQPGWTNEEFPVKDSPVLLPFSVKKDYYKQIWVTVHVPEDAEAGVYNGKIELTSEGMDIGALNLELNVLPFALNAPKTRYDNGKTFASAIYYKGILAEKGALLGWDKTEEQYRADLKNMLAHGVTSPTIHELEVKEDFRDFDRAIRIRKEMGISIDPLYLLGPERNLKQGSTKDPEKIAQAVKYFKKIGEVTRRYGIKTVYVYGVDEAAGDKLFDQADIWSALKIAGARIYTSGFMHRTPEAYKLGKYADVFVNYGKPYRTYARQWHDNGGKIWAYANPQGGVENPVAYRKGFGFPLWLSNYDGACTYVYNHGYGHTWNDFDCDRYRDHNLTYPTINGVVDTIAWEGYREAIDDIRYGSTLQAYIEKFKNSNDYSKRQIARDAEAWLEELTGYDQDLGHIRSQMIDWILKLN